MSTDTPLVLVSNRGPVTFQPGGEIKRGTGGLVTALIGLASYRPVTWVASAMTAEAWATVVEPPSSVIVTVIW